MKCSLCNTFTALATVGRRTVAALMGSTVSLPCTTTHRTPVDWDYQRSEKDDVKKICTAGTIRDWSSKRYGLSRKFFGDFSLLIFNVTVEDTGEYTCTEDVGVGVQHRVHLTVHGSYIYIFIRTNCSHKTNKATHKIN